MSDTNDDEPAGRGRLSRRERAPSPTLVFSVALLIRIVLAAVFLGTIDATGGVTAMPVAANHGYVAVPYFPLPANWLGLAGFLYGHWIGVARALGIDFTAVPIALVPKLFPCIADSLIATWFALDQRQSPAYRRRSAWMYATCPLPLLIVCSSGQWDSIWILAMITAIALSASTNASRGIRYGAGALFAFGLLVKPTPIVLLPLLFDRFRSRHSLAGYLRRIRPLVVSVVVALVVAFSWFALEGFDLPQNLHFVLNYSVYGPSGVSALGLSQLTFLQHLEQSTGIFRDLSVGAVAVVLLRYHLARRESDPMATAAAILLLVPAIGGINAQYLLWPLPFMLAARRFRVSVIYGALCAFLIFAYCVFSGVWVGGPTEETTFLLPLRPLQFLAIPDGAKAGLASGVAAAVLHPVFDVVLPVAMIALALWLLRPAPARSERPAPMAAGAQARLSLGAVGVFVVSAIVYSLGPYPGLSAVIASHYGSALHGYALHGHALHGLPALPADAASGTWWTSALVLAPALFVVWSIAGLRRHRWSPAPVPRPRELEVLARSTT
ncbi:MAG TPA: hypothetical protein VLZ77_04345 [Acidimicrobiales bacterium]|nr:hypothetical protein [Acidimicrobiales bacterium]